jgi:hypothetical protein
MYVRSWPLFVRRKPESVVDACVIMAFGYMQDGSVF